ncbi:MAG TPA: FAD-dependent oxidoreductase [Ilumatobacteraceae bacterium]|jgi:3-phenylpropionate/trans-cinnamate dioxygenase ferredoxin reductase subunit
MTTDQTLVIVGASLAGAKAAEGARAGGFDGRVVLVGDEQEPPYERPPLSKAVLRGEAPPETARVHDNGFYAARGIELWTGRTVEGLDPGTHHVRLDGDERLSFTTAVVATGAAPRRLDIPGSDLAGVHYLRSVGDSVQLGDAIRTARRVAVIGAGWIGSEVAASARQMGAEVVLIDPAPTPLHRVLGDEIGKVFCRLHADHGAQLRLRTGVAELRGNGTVQQVVLSNGDVEAADVVVIGVGVTPRVELAVAAGLKVENGIVVDEQLQSSVPGVYAAGDVASAWHPHYGRYLRVEHWFNAVNQGLTAGSNAAGGSGRYTHLPYFFSDQYDLGMEYVGFSDPTDAVAVRGSLPDREFISFWHRDGIVTAAMNVNIWDVVDELKAIVAGGRRLDPSRLADPDVALADLASQESDDQ